MDQPPKDHWRKMFETKRRDRPPGTEPAFGQPHATPRRQALGGYDDGFDPAQREAGDEMPRPSLSPEEITDEAAMALALDTTDYKPWVLQRGRSRPAMMLHLRRFEPKSGLWVGWQLAYPHLVAVEYTGDRMLSLDFGTRQFMIEGSGLGELARHLQTGSVLMVQEFSVTVWSGNPSQAAISSIARLGISSGMAAS